MTINTTDLFVLGRGTDAYKVSAKDVRDFMTAAHDNEVTIHKPAALLNQKPMKESRYVTPYGNQASITGIMTTTWTPPDKSNAALLIATFDGRVFPNDTYDYGSTNMQIVRASLDFKFTTSGRNAKSVANNTNSFGCQMAWVFPHNPKADKSGNAEFVEYQMKSRVDVIKYDATGGDITFDYTASGVKCGPCVIALGGAQTRIALIPFEAAAGTL